MGKRYSCKGFSLIELVAILVLVGVISIYVIPGTLDSNVFQVQSSRDEIVTALFLAQQTAMARDSTANPIQFVASVNAIDVRENGVPIAFPGMSYPLALPNGVTITGGVGTLDYDKLGRVVDGVGNPISAAITVSGSSASTTVTVSASGYAD